MTKVAIIGNQFLIDGVLTYPGRMFNGKKVEGLLFNLRAVQATFDDENAGTQQNWNYPDTGAWDAQRNVDEFCAALPAWREHGVLAFTINFQGGGPLYTPDIYSNYVNNAFHPNGITLRLWGEASSGGCGCAWYGGDCWIVLLEAN